VVTEKARLPGQPLGAAEVIGVHTSEKRGASLTGRSKERSCNTAMRLAKNSEARIRLRGPSEYLRGPILRAVIHGDDLEPIEALTEETLEALWKVGRGVEAREKDADLGSHVPSVIS
jgi:hypothetical protein